MKSKLLIHRIRQRLAAFGDPAGLAATEYAILLALIVLGSVGVIGMIGQKFQVLYSLIADAVGSTI